MNTKTTSQQLLLLISVGFSILIGCKGSNTAISGTGADTDKTTLTLMENKKEDAVFFAPVFISAPIDTAVASAYRSAYRNDKKQLKTIDSTKDIHKQVPLEGFAFDARQIDTIINHNASGQTPDQIVFYFGLDSKRGFLGKKNRKWHIIAYGRYKGKLLDYLNAQPRAAVATAAAQVISVYDKADPCPPCKTP